MFLVWTNGFQSDECQEIHEIFVKKYTQSWLGSPSSLSPLGSWRADVGSADGVLLLCSADKGPQCSSSHSWFGSYSL